jgi:hypothetical protein
MRLRHVVICIALPMAADGYTGMMGEASIFHLYSMYWIDIWPFRHNAYRTRNDSGRSVADGQKYCRLKTTRDRAVKLARLGGHPEVGFGGVPWEDFEGRIRWSLASPVFGSATDDGTGQSRPDAGGAVLGVWADHPTRQHSALGHLSPLGQERKRDSRCHSTSGFAQSSRRRMDWRCQSAYPPSQHEPEQAKMTHRICGNKCGFDFQEKSFFCMKTER